MFWIVILMPTYSRKSPRAKWHDYTAGGGYFITICTKDREHYFGEIDDGQIILHLLWQCCYDEIKKLWERNTIDVHEWVVMPNHVHILLVIKERSVGADHQSALKNGNWYYKGGLLNKGDLQNRPYNGPSVSSLVKLFKWKISKFAIKNNIIFAWQRSFYDHIIRNEGEYERIKYYIQQNPEKRAEDKFHSQL